MTPLRYVINNFYHAPRSFVKVVSRFGLINYIMMKRGMRRMESAAKQLTFSLATPEFNIYFLTGKKFLFQTLFCIHSLEKKSAHSFMIHLYDDGSFDEQLIETIKKQLPNVVINTKEQIEARLSGHLPASRFPYLNHKRKVYPHIKKLTDIHCGTTGWKLVLDSDMLFTSYPSEVIAWLGRPEEPLYMLDSDYAYGFPKQAMEKMSGKKIPDLLNVGLIGLKSESINWENLEYWAKSLETEFGNTYYLEQGLTAMVIGDMKSEVLPPESYIVNPVDVPDGAKLLHFVDLSKAPYFRTEWERL